MVQDRYILTVTMADQLKKMALFDMTFYWSDQ